MQILLKLFSDCLTFLSQVCELACPQVFHKLSPLLVATDAGILFFQLLFDLSCLSGKKKETKSDTGGTAMIVTSSMQVVETYSAVRTL